MSENDSNNPPGERLADEIPNNPPGEKLAYEIPRKPADSPAAIVIVAILAAGLGAITPLVLGAILFLSFNFSLGGPPVPNPPTPLSISPIPAIVFAVLTILAALAGIRAFRRFPRRWFFIGFAIGFGVMSLIEGGCFIFGA
jgi:hypothetical protein